MAMSVQLVSKAASEKLSIKYSDLPLPKNEETPEPKRLSLQAFLISNYANSPRRWLSVDPSYDNGGSPCEPVFDSRRRPTEFYASSKMDEPSFFISLKPMAEEKLCQLRNCVASPGALIKKGCGGTQRPKEYQALSWKYKLFYICGVSNIDMVDNYVTLPRYSGTS